MVTIRTGRVIGGNIMERNQGGSDISCENMTGIIVWDVASDTCSAPPALLDALGIQRPHSANTCPGADFRTRVPVAELPRLFEIALAPDAVLRGFDTVYTLCDRTGHAWTIRHTGHLMLDEAGRPFIVFGNVAPVVGEPLSGGPADQAANIALRLHDLAMENGWQSVRYAIEIALLELVRLHQEAVPELN